MSTPCPGCGCADARGDAAHAIVAALVQDDLDGAIGAGLCGDAHCTACAPECVALLSAARVARRSALAARDRYRARQARLEQRKQARDAARSASMPTPTAPRPVLPAAAAAALARAKAKAAERGKP